METSQPLSQPPLSPQWAYEQSGHGGRDECYTWAQQHELQLNKADLAMATAECPICQQQRPTMSPRYGTVPQGAQPAAWSQVDYIGPIPSWKGQHLVLPGTDPFSGYGFAFLAHNASVRTTILLTGYCIYHHGSLHSIVSDQRTHLTAKEVWQCPRAHGIHWPHLFPTILKQLAWWNGGMAF